MACHGLNTSLILIRGLPGSGKTSLAKELAAADPTSLPASREAVAADDFRVDENGEYLWIPGREANEDAHGKCIAEARRLVKEGCDTIRTASIIVHNTFVRLWEMDPYRKMAREFGCKIQIITVHDPLVSNEELFERCEHGVPLSDIADMRRRFQHQVEYIRY